MDEMLDEINGVEPRGHFKQTMETLMTAEPKYWEDDYLGNDLQKMKKRHYSYSDRIRYYCSREAKQAILALMEA